MILKRTILPSEPRLDCRFRTLVVLPCLDYVERSLRGDDSDVPAGSDTPWFFPPTVHSRYPQGACAL